MFKDLPIFDALKSRMRWQQARHTVLSENVANADTPGYKARDLKELSFNRMMASASMRSAPMVATSMARTSQAHLTGGLSNQTNGFKAGNGSSFEVTPSRNSVVLEEQMMEVASNQLDYQTATSIYSKSLGLLRTAIRRR